MVFNSIVGTSYQQGGDVTPFIAGWNKEWRQIVGKNNQGKWVSGVKWQWKKEKKRCVCVVLCSVCGKTDETDHQKKNNTNNKKRTVVPQKRDGCLPNALVCFFQYDILFGGPCFFVDIGV